MAVKIRHKTGMGAGQELPIKRLYLPYVISSKCPGCGAEVEFDDYASYPVLGVSYSLPFYHVCDEDNDGEQEEWFEEVFIDVVVKAAR